MSVIDNIRKEIQHITEHNAYDDKVSKLIERFPEQISKYGTICNYLLNCYAFALGFENSDKYVEMCRKQADKYPKDNGARSDFMSYLIEKRYLKEILNPIENCLVIYCNNKGSPMHAGILQENRDGDDKIIRSKWGNLEEIKTNDYGSKRIPIILAHKLWYVPTDYGTEIKYYEPLNKEESEKYFYEYLNEIKVSRLMMIIQTEIIPL